MADARRVQPVSAEDLLAVVRVYADRVHDLVRRLGCSPAAAVEVTEASAHDLVQVVARTPQAVPDLVGWWFARARGLGRSASDGDHDLPLGGGLLAADEDQQLIAEGLEQLPERERVALLLRDSYDLSDGSVAAALGADPEAAMQLVGHARLAFLPYVDDPGAPVPPGHDVALASFARLALPGPTAARDATPRRHAQSCAVCGAVVAAQERGHLLLAGISVVALPERDREGMLARVEVGARAALPSAAALAAASAGLVEDEEDEDDLGPRRLLTPLSALAGLFLAVVAGVGLGALLSRDDTLIGPARSTDALPAVTADPVPTLAPPPRRPTPSRAPSAFPSDSVFTVTPRPEPTPTAAPPPPPPTSAPPEEESLGITLEPSSGPNGALIAVNGTGWTPGTEVSVVYYDTLDRPTTSRADALVDARGRFTTMLGAFDPMRIPGAHEVRASDGTQEASAVFQAQS